MANEEHLAKLKEGVLAWNEWRKAFPQVTPDLSQSRLQYADLTAADLLGTKLESSKLSRAVLRRADLYRADLTDARLFEADLTEAYLRATELGGAYLVGANLREADLREANLSSADLSNANLTGAYLGYTSLTDNDLSSVKGLETIQHRGPSSISIDTVYKSMGKIPYTFLRRAGVPDIFIEYMSSLMGKALEFYSCFISYSSKDQELADRIYADLLNTGVRCWFAPHDIQGGKKLHEQIDVTIRRYERLLLILSPSSMNSKWVSTEIRNARKRELREKKQVLFPLLLTSYEALRDWKLFDADEGEDLASVIREYYIPDFSNWKNHDPYKSEFEKLLRDLRMDRSK